MSPNPQENVVDTILTLFSMGGVTILFPRLDLRSKMLSRHFVMYPRKISLKNSKVL